MPCFAPTHRARMSMSAGLTATSAPATVEEIAQQFEQQGICATSENATSRLWCSYCTAHLNASPSDARDGLNNEVKEEAREVSQGSVGSASGSNAAHPTDSLCIVGTTCQDVLEHCATRLHLLLYERQAQDHLRQWCPVELHGYRMLLNHHCVYPRHMFGNGRLLMDLTIAGGMLLGVDVCGGIKLWPQHRYAAAELVLPAARSGVREVQLQPSPANTGWANGRDCASVRKRPHRDMDSVQLLHDASETVMHTVGAAKTDDAAKPEISQRFLAQQTGRLLSVVPRYFDEDHGAQSQRVTRGSLASVLEATNASIIGEARLRQERRRVSLKHNVMEAVKQKATEEEREQTFESDAP